MITTRVRTDEDGEIAKFKMPHAPRVGDMLVLGEVNLSFKVDRVCWQIDRPTIDNGEMVAATLVLVVSHLSTARR